MPKTKRVLTIILFGLTLCFALTASSAVTQEPTSTVTQTASGDTKVTDPNPLLTYGPTGGIISIIIGGVLMISKSINEGRTIQVTHYKERAEQASTEAAGDMKKLRDQMNTMEAKLDEVLADRDELRETLENRKAQFSKDLLAMEKRHQAQLLDTHAVLLQQLNIRQRLERILTEHGIEIPLMSEPPSTEPPTTTQ